MIRGRLLTHMLSGIVYSLRPSEYLKMGLRTLGKSHEKYGVRPEYYPLVEEILLETIRGNCGRCTIGPRLETGTGIYYKSNGDRLAVVETKTENQNAAN
ncbi:MAG: hypothetical protein R2824_16400 [Saprospiraceae bacterium]